MDVASITALISTVVSVLTMIGSVITVLIKLGKYQEKVDNLEKILDGVLTHEQVNSKLQSVRDALDTAVATLHEKVNQLRDEAASNDKVSDLSARVANIRTDLEVLKDGVGRVIDTMSSTEESITALLAEARGDEVRLKSLESFRNEANEKIRQVELQLARLGDRPE